MSDVAKSAAITLAQQWATNPYFDLADRQEIQKLLELHNWPELEERFYKNLEFGTGGIRSVLGMGPNRINKYTVRKATQALANTVLKHPAPHLAVAISYDTRHFSLEFARETAQVLAANGIASFLFTRPNPVSFLSYLIREKKCLAGVMITASHNPPEYNGYKVFWSDGAQVTPPYDEEIIAHYNALTDFSQVKTCRWEDTLANRWVQWVGEDFEDQFVAKLAHYCLQPELCAKRGKELHITYTSIHGTGLHPISKIFQAYHLDNFHLVQEQTSFDGNFPTVKSPNPENPSALKLAVDQMLAAKGDIAVGTDPDADRIGVAVNHQGKVYYLNGNQLGVLMLHYICTQLTAQGEMPPRPYFVQSIVTTPLQVKIAQHFQVEAEKTLTGFKWIGRRMEEILRDEPERTFLFGTEESFGFCNHPYVRDKDATGPMGLLGEMALWYKVQGKTLIDALDAISEFFGLAQEELLSLDYFGKAGCEKIERIMDLFRKQLIHQVGEEVVVAREDYLTLKCLHLPSNKTTDLKSFSSNVLGYQFASGNILYLRPSGTEPKIKFYYMVQETKGVLAEKKQRASARIQGMMVFLRQQAEKA